MNAAKKMKGLIVLSKEKLDVVIATMNTVESLSFPPNVVRSMEVIDKVALTSLVRVFIETKKIPPTSFSLVLHDSLLFEKLIEATQPQLTEKPATVPPNPTATPQPVSPPSLPEPIPVVKVPKPTAAQSMEDEEKQIQQFTDTVPFEDVLIKTMKTPQGKLIIVANKDLVSIISDAFETNGMSVDQVIAVTQLGKDISLAGGVTPVIGQQLLVKVDALRGQSMIPEPPPATAGPVALGMPRKDSEKKRLFLMVGIFVVLIGVLVFAYMNMQSQNASLVTPPAKPQMQVAETPLPTDLAPTESASSSAYSKLSYPIELQGAIVNSSMSAALDSTLRQAGYQNIIKKQQGESLPATVISFTADVPVDIQQEIIQLVSTLDAEVLVQENNVEISKIVIIVK